MDRFSEMLAANELFAGVNGEPGLLPEPDACILGRYPNGAIIMQEGDPCASIGFVLTGLLAVQQISRGGEIIRIQTLKRGDSFGDALIFNPRPAYLYTLTSVRETSVLFVPFAQIRALIDKSPAFSRNYILYLSQRVQAFQRKIRILSQRDVRSRLILFLAGEAEKQGSTAFSLKRTRAEIAELIGVARPSVPRELRRMEEDGLLATDGKAVTLLVPGAFGIKGLTRPTPG
jgi:CRP/FNR family transcriptional regulator, dissimilatory nitrate respiration regulator